MRLVNRPGLAVLSLLLALLPARPAAAVAVEGLYEGVVAGDLTESGRAAAASDALRQVVVRVTGRGSAAADPTLAPLYAEAPRLVETFRSVAAGQVAVSFDGATLEARLVKAGQRLWSRERPATLVMLLAGPAGAAAPGAAPTATLRRDVVAAAQARGLPLVWPAPLPPAAEQARAADAAAGRLESLLEQARQVAAEGVLVGRAGPSGVAWSYAGAAGDGPIAAATAAEAIDAIADRYGQQLAASPTDAGHLVVVVRGVRDLASYAAAVAAVGALPAVRSATLEEVAGPTVRLRVAFDGNPDALRRAVRDSPRLQLDDAGAPNGALAVALRP